MRLSLSNWKELRASDRLQWRREQRPGYSALSISLVTKGMASIVKSRSIPNSISLVIVVSAETLPDVMRRYAKPGAIEWLSSSR